MKVIKPGNPDKIPVNRTYRGTCPNCDCEFEFETKEITYDHQKEEAFVCCPECNQKCTMTKCYVRYEGEIRFF